MFVSYCRSDKEYVERLVRFLAGMGITAWFDSEMGLGDRFGRVLQQRIDGCAAFVLVMTPAAADSDWVERELAWVDGRRKPIVPLLLEGDPFFSTCTLHHYDATDGSMPGGEFVIRLQGLTIGAPRS